MKNFRVYTPEKYSTPDYIKVEENIYQQAPDREYVTSLSFEQEPELGEGDSPQDISQYPLEDILEEFEVQIEDFYEDSMTPVRARAISNSVVVTSSASVRYWGS
ncbi:TPA: hypothetical protein NBM48_000099 [Corynebacterium striatum]|nr:hypothetical protein [Corynebacterium striatum]